MKHPGRVGLFVLLPALIALVLKVFVADVYRVDSGSMKPTIHGAVEDGEFVLVRYDHHPVLERFDLAVLLRSGEREPIVKRVVGLPGEELLIRDGDLVIDGAKLGPRVPRPAPVLVFDSDQHALEGLFDFSGDWQAVPGVALAARGAPGQACWRSGVHDDYLDPDGQRVPGRHPVGDLVLECTLRFPPEYAAGDGVLALSLSEEGDVFELRIEPVEAGRVELILVRHRGGAGETRLGFAQANLVAESGTRPRNHPPQAHALRFSNVDDVLAVELDGRRLLEVPYKSNTPLVGAADPRLNHRRPRVCLTAVQIEVQIERLRILRDLHYTEFGDLGVLGPVNLAEDEFFCLGDHSGESVDGRTFGPVARHEIFGVPLAVVWPLGQARFLRPVVAPPGDAPGPSN